VHTNGEPNPPDLACQRHPDRPAVASCTSCDALVCADCRRADPDSLTLCPRCAVVDDVDGAIDVDWPPAPTWSVPPPALPAPDPTPRLSPPPDVAGVAGPEPLPWEQGGRYGTFEALGRTVIDALRAPFTFMGRIPWVRRDFRTPLIFALLCGLLGQVPLQLGQTDAMASIWKTLGVDPLAGTLIALSMMPLVLALEILLESALAHGLLRLIGANARPYETTFRVYCYANVSAIVLMVPYLGFLVQPFLMVIFLLSGLRIGQKTTFTQALLGLAPHLLLPLLVGLGMLGGPLGV